jgi:Lipocalin-like domain
MFQESIVGTWRLISFHGRKADGTLRLAFGENPQGLLVYTVGGHMIAILSEPNRESFCSSNFRGGIPEEALAAVNSYYYISYFGRYEVHGDEVIHHVEMSLFPNWIGQDQVQKLRFADGNLILSTPSFLLSGPLGLGPVLSRCHFNHRR